MNSRRYLDVHEAAQYLHFPTTGAFRAFLHRRRTDGRPIRVFHRGGKLLFTETDLDASLDVEEAAPRPVRRRA